MYDKERGREGGERKRIVFLAFSAI